MKEARQYILDIKKEQISIAGRINLSLMLDIEDAMKKYAMEVARETMLNAQQAALEASKEGPESALEAIVRDFNIPILL